MIFISLIFSSMVAAAASSCPLCKDLGTLTVTPKGFAKLAKLILQEEIPGIVQDLKTERIDAHRKGFKLSPKESELFNCEPALLTQALCQSIDCLNLSSSQMIHQKKFDVISSSSCKPIEIQNAQGKLEYRATESHLKNFWITDISFQFVSEPDCDVSSCNLDVEIPKMVFRGDFDLSTVESVQLVEGKWQANMQAKI